MDERVTEFGLIDHLASLTGKTGAGSGRPTPTGSWWWLVVDTPHTGTPFDLAQTIGSALVVIGLSLLLGHWAPRSAAVAFGAGAMTLSLYTAHVCLVAAMYQQPLPVGWTEEGVYAAQALTAVLIGGSFAALHWRGPRRTRAGTG